MLCYEVDDAPQRLANRRMREMLDTQLAGSSRNWLLHSIAWIWALYMICYDML